jgi:hypothetical protein
VRNKHLILACLLCGVGNAAAENGQSSFPEWNLSGRAFGDLYYPTVEHRGKTFQQLSASLWVQGDGRFSDSFSARAIYQGDLFDGRESRLTGDRSGTHLRNRLREGYVEYFAGGFQARVGQQIIPWGKSDGINPTDFLSAKESSFLNHDSEVTRVGGVSLLLSFTPQGGASPWNLTAVAQPYFPESTYLVPPTALPSGVTLEETERPSRNLENTEFAGKLSYTGQSWDASASYFHGFQHRPEFVKLSHTVLSPTLTLIRLARRFHRVNAAGMDASFSQGAWIYRIESAYTWTENKDGSNPLITPTHWDAVAGVERALFEKLRMNVQLVSRYFPRYTDPGQATGASAVEAAINRQIAAANALLQQYQRQWHTAATLRLAYAPEGSDFGAEILWYHGLNDDDYYLRPLLSYGLAESLKIFLGYDHYGGPADKSIGSLRSYNAIFSELKYTF